jgi:hypothetical protein
MQRDARSHRVFARRGAKFSAADETPYLAYIVQGAQTVVVDFEYCAQSPNIAVNMPTRVRPLIFELTALVVILHRDSWANSIAVQSLTQYLQGVYKVPVHPVLWGGQDQEAALQIAVAAALGLDVAPSTNS